jgi:hypothetical protein
MGQPFPVRYYSVSPNGDTTSARSVPDGRVVDYSPAHNPLDPHWPRDMAFTSVVMNLDTRLCVHRPKASLTVQRSRLRRLDTCFLLATGSLSALIC